MKKVIEFGKVDYHNRGKKTNLVRLELELKNKEGKGYVFTASGEVWQANMRDIYMSGQCIDSIWNEFANQIEKKALYLEIMNLWKRNHLNDMNAGTAEQEAAIEQWKKQGNKYEYTAACNYLKSIDLYEVEHNGKPYKYGHAWIYSSISSNDLKRIKEIIEETEEPVES